MSRAFFTVYLTKQAAEDVKDCTNVDEVRHLGLYRVYLKGTESGEHLGHMEVRIKNRVLYYQSIGRDV
jgi:hypothetical protein